jgi:two-component system nitrate/nitrite response regulator NarL
VISVAVVDDHPIFRRGLADLVAAAEGMTLVLAAASVEELDAAIDAEPPDVVLLDLHLPGMSGPDAVEHVCRAGAYVLVLSAEGKPDLVVHAIGAGASGYLTKDADADEIVAAIEAVAGGTSYISPILASYLLKEGRAPAPQPELELTAREKEILGLVAEGERDKNIARQLYISISTVRTHLDRIRDKTGQRRRAELTRYAIEQGLAGRPANPGDHAGG